ncbi:MAG: hypothetical protein ACM362_01145 [Candidatus Methylomirabilota bacterium]
MRRAAFWVVFLVLAAAAFTYIWRTKDPLRNNPYLLPLWVRYNVRLMAHSHPDVAQKAWLELWNLYFTKWAVYQTFPEHLASTQPISFLIERQSFPRGGDNAPAMDGFFARNKPIYYKAERIYCRTVSEALMAIMYREKKWTVDYQGDWQAWWQANGKYYR